jgi:hypothetical protein
MSRTQGFDTMPSICSATRSTGISACEDVAHAGVRHHALDLLGDAVDGDLGL